MRCLFARDISWQMGINLRMDVSYRRRNFLRDDISIAGDIKRARHENYVKIARYKKEKNMSVEKAFLQYVVFE